MTNLLELLTGGKVELQTIKQQVVSSPKGPANMLNIDEGESVNERDIIMVRSSDGHPLLYAKSYTPISRLEPGFKTDLMKADIPIGKIMEKYQIEARRELIGIGLLDANASLEKLLHRPGPFIWRSYNIITREEPLITIRETFAESIYRLPAVGSS
jgi:beta-ribofuranosylaminobenzene 5'-phosphate synthase